VVSVMMMTLRLFMKVLSTLIRLHHKTTSSSTERFPRPVMCCYCCWWSRWVDDDTPHWVYCRVWPWGPGLDSGEPPCGHPRTCWDTPPCLTAGMVPSSVDVAYMAYAETLPAHALSDLAVCSPVRKRAIRVFLRNIRSAR